MRNVWVWLAGSNTVAVTIEGEFVLVEGNALEQLICQKAKLTRLPDPFMIVADLQEDSCCVADTSALVLQSRKRFRIARRDESLASPQPTFQCRIEVQVPTLNWSAGQIKYMVGNYRGLKDVHIRESSTVARILELAVGGSGVYLLDCRVVPNLPAFREKYPWQVTRASDVIDLSGPVRAYL